VSLCAELLPLFALTHTAWQPTVITSDSQSNVLPPSLHLYGFGVTPYTLTYLSLASALVSMKVAHRHLISVTHAHTDTHTHAHSHMYTG